MAERQPEIMKSAGRSSSPESSELEAIVRKVVGDILETDPQSIDPDAQLVEDLGMDSMMALEILATIEKRFRIKVPEENLPKMSTLNHILQVARQYARP